jgi:hypothetical protein
MDISRSESAHQDVPIGLVTLVISQAGVEITIENRRSGEPSETLTFPLNNTKKKNVSESGLPIAAKAHWDGLKMVTETEREIDGSTVTTMQVYTLGVGAKEIAVQKTLTIQHGYQSPGSAKTTGSGKDVFIKVTTN